MRLERKIPGIIVADDLGIGLFALIVSMTVREMTNTFAFAIPPIMIATLAGIMAITLIFIGTLCTSKPPPAPRCCSRRRTRSCASTAWPAKRAPTS